jgi:putative addiction module component (TIGR02574 family)
MSVDAILKEIAALTNAERGELLDRLAEQFPDTSAEEGISPELAKLLDERVTAADANPDAGVPWEVVYEESLKRARR